MTDTPLRILSLDGGGVRGISSLYILRAVMDQIARENNTEDPDAPELFPRPCEYFDLICGTSTGGLIALMLGRLRMVCVVILYPDL
jgi:patatin-like phospholipase/acyl hydrolase